MGCIFFFFKISFPPSILSEEYGKSEQMNEMVTTVPSFHIYSNCLILVFLLANGIRAAPKDLRSLRAREPESQRHSPAKEGLSHTQGLVGREVDSGSCS